MYVVIYLKNNISVAAQLIGMSPLQFWEILFNLLPAF